MTTLSAVTTLRALTNNTERLLTERLRPVGITVPQLEFLTWIAAHPECSGADVADATHVSPQTGTTVLHNLAVKRLISISPGKGRRNRITVTADGAAAITQAQGAVAEVEKHLTAALGDKHAARSLNSAVTALQPHLPQRGSKTKKAKKAHRDPLADDRAKADEVDQRCREWATALGNGTFVPDHVAHQFGTETQIDLLVVTQRWSPERNGYRLND